MPHRRRAEEGREETQITFRMLLGAPVLSATVNGDDWIKAMKKMVGDSAGNITFNVATMTTSYSGTPVSRSVTTRPRGTIPS